MTIKSDRWIVEQASKGMIEPFEAGQIRTNEDGGKVISYGTSSYGYDVRCANQFKVFTNIHIWLFLMCWKAGGGLIPIVEADLPEHGYKSQ